MAREKRKKKKSSQTNCEISSQETDSHGTTTNHGQNPATTECTCLSKSQKRKRFLLCCVATELPYCPIHTSEGGAVIQKTKPRKAENGTTRQPSLIRRIGRWLIKKMTKGKQEEHIPDKPIESISATVCINPNEPPRLQMLCQQVLSVDGLQETTQAYKADVISVESESVIVTVSVDVHHESSAISQNELCRAVVEIADDKNTSVTDSKQEIAYDEEQNKENDTKPDTYDINPEYVQHTGMTLKEMCEAAVTYLDDTKIDLTDDKEHEEANEFELDNKRINPECDNTMVRSLTELCTKAISSADDRKPIEVENNDKANDNETDTKDKIPECDTNNVMSLKEMYTSIVRIADRMTTRINTIEKYQANDVKEATTDKPPKCEKTMTLSLKELCSTAIRYADDLNRGTNDTTEERVHNNELDEANENKDNITDNDLECVKYAANGLKDLCSAATSNANYMKTSVDDTKLNLTSDKDKKESNNSEPSSYDVNHKSDKEHDEANESELDNKRINPECDNTMVRSLSELCTKAISSADDRKPIEVEKNDKANDNETDSKDKIPECDTNNVMSLKEMYTAIVRIADRMTTSINAIENYQANDVKKATTDKTPKCEKTMTLSLKQLCSTAIRYADDLNRITNDTTEERVHGKELDEANENKDTITDNNLESDKYSAKGLKELCSAATRNANDMKTSVDGTKLNMTSEKDQKESNNSEPISYDVNHKSDNASVQSQKELCLETLKNDDYVKPGVSDTLEDQTGEKELNEADDKNIAMTLTELEQKYPTNYTDLNKTNRTKQAQVDYTNLERTKEAKENKAKDQPNDSGQVQAIEAAADRGSHMKQERATVNTNKTTDTADTKADDVGKDNENDTKNENSTETAHATENGHQDVNADGYNPGLFLPVGTLCQLMIDVYNERRFKSGKKHRNKVTMQREINNRINMDQGISNDGVKEHTDKEHRPRNINEETIRKMEKYKIGQVDSNNGGNDGTDSDIDASKIINPTAEIGVGAKPKKRNLANENIIQAALKKIQDEVAIQPDCVPRSKAVTNITASEANRHVERHQWAEAKICTGGEHEPKPKPEPKLLSESHTEQNKDTTPCIDAGSSNTEISHGTYRKKKQKRKKAKWY